MNKTKNIKKTKDEEDAGKRSRTVTSTHHPLPDTRTSFDTHHIAILKAYVTLSPSGNRELKYSDFSKTLLGFNPQYVSGNNKFLESIGILMPGERGGRYKPSQATIDFCNNLNWKKDDDAKSLLRKLLRDTWFWKSTKNLLNMREKVSYEDLISELGHEARADPTKHRGSLVVLTDYLNYTGLIKKDDKGNITLIEKEKEIKLPKGEIEKKEVRGVVEEKVGEKEAEALAQAKERIPIGTIMNVNINIGVEIASDMTEEEIKKKIKALFKTINEYR